MAILVLGKCSANFGRQILGKALEFPGKRLQKSLPECCFTLDTDFDWLRQKNKPRMANFPIENIAHERCNGLHGKHGVGVPESEPRSRSPGVGVPESDVIKIWKTRSHMENTESDVREKYGKHGVWRIVSVKYGK